jgi:hypothetical protein
MRPDLAERWLRPSVLGLAVTPGAVLCAQVQRRGGATVVQRLARLPLASNAWESDPEALGRQLGQFLRGHGFSARRAVIGVPARWLVSHQRDLPPADAAKARAMLRLAAERLASAEQANLLFDVAGEPGDREASKALLVGMLRARREALGQCAAAAGLQMLAITPTALAMASRCREARGSCVMLTERGAEVVCGGPRGALWLAHLGIAPAPDEGALRLASQELRRGVMMMPGDAGAAKLLRIEGAGWSETQAQSLAHHAALPLVSAPQLATLPVSTDPAAMNGDGDTSGNSIAPAVAVALCGLEARLLPLNLWQPRLAPPPEARVKRQTVLAAAAAIMLVVGLASLYLTVRQREAQVAEAQNKLAELQPQIAAAESSLQRIKLGRGYFQSRPPVLDALRQITLAVPAEDPLWMRSITIRDGMLINLQGTAGNQQVVLGLLDRLRRDGEMADVRLLDLHDEGRGGASQISFSIDVRYTGAEGPR